MNSRTLTITQRIEVDEDNNYISGVIESATLAVNIDEDKTEKRVSQEEVVIPGSLLAMTLEVAIETVAGILDSK